ncbi:lipopolysaccharide biosynthesis protein [Methylobacterium sp. CM6257]
MIWYVPYLIRHLGPASYGIVPLANSIVIYAGVISEGLNTSIYRYLAIDLGRSDGSAARQTFNGAAALTLLACAGLTLPAAVITWLFPSLFNVPAGTESQARFLFASVSATMVAAVIGGLFGTSSQIAHRFDLRNAVRAATLIVRVGLVVLCSAIWPANLWHVGVGFLASAFIALLCEVLTWRYLTPQLVFRPHEARLDVARRFLGLGGWSSVNVIGIFLLTQIDLVIVNAVFGAEMTGRYGSLLVLPALIATFAEIVVPILSPEIMARYAVEDFAGIERLARQAVRLISVALALPAGLLCGFGAPLLSLWLGSGFAELDWVLALLCGHLAINLATRPLAYILTAYNKVRAQAIVSLTAGVADIILALALARWSGWGVAGVAAATAFIWTAKNVLFLALYCASIVGARWWSFVLPLVPGLIGVLSVTLAGKILTHLCAPSTWLSLVTVAGTVALAYCVISYGCLVTGPDRRLIRGLILRRL